MFLRDYNPKLTVFISKIGYSSKIKYSTRKEKKEHAKNCWCAA